MIIAFIENKIEMGTINSKSPSSREIAMRAAKVRTC